MKRARKKFRVGRTDIQQSLEHELLRTCSHHNSDRLPKTKTTKLKFVCMKRNMTAPNHLNGWNKKKGHREKRQAHIRLHAAHQQKMCVCEYVLCSSSIEHEQLASSSTSSVWLMEEKKKFRRKINPSFSWQSICIPNDVNERELGEGDREREWERLETKNTQHLYCCMCILVTYNVKMIPRCVCV